MNAEVRYLPAPHLAIVTADDGRKVTMGGVFSEAAAERAKETAIALWDAADAAEAERQQEAERRRQLWEEGKILEAAAQRIAKAAATPQALGFLTFLKLVHHKETVPYFDEITAELARLADEEKAAIDGEAH